MKKYAIISVWMLAVLTVGCDDDNTEEVAAVESDAQSTVSDITEPIEAGNSCFYTCAGEETQCITEDSGEREIMSDLDCDIAAGMMCDTSFDLESYSFYENCSCYSMEECAATEAMGACAKMDAYCDANEDYALVTCTDGVPAEPTACEEGLACYHMDDKTAACVAPNACIIRCNLNDTEGNPWKDSKCQTTTDQEGLFLVQSQEECDALATAHCETAAGQGWSLTGTKADFKKGEGCGDFDNGLDRLGQCEPGEIQCYNADYEECDEDGVWTGPMQCPEGQQCTVFMGEQACRD